MDCAGQNEGQQRLVDRRISVSAAFEGSEEIALARDLARSFLTDVQAVHGLPVSARAMGMVQLVVSEMVTNARKYAPGPCLLRGRFHLDCTGMNRLPEHEVVGIVRCQVRFGVCGSGGVAGEAR